MNSRAESYQVILSAGTLNSAQLLMLRSEIDFVTIFCLCTTLDIICTNWAIEILIAVDHIDDFHSIVEWALRVTFKSLAFLFTGKKGENVLQKLEQKSIWNNFQEPSCGRKSAGPLWHRSSHVHSWPGSGYFPELCPMLHCPQNND